MAARLELVRKGSARATFAEPPQPAPQSAQTVEARHLVDSWLKTSFIARGDAVEDLIGRIATRLAERDARLDAHVPADDDRPLCNGR